MGKQQGKTGWAVAQTPGRSMQGPRELQPPPWIPPTHCLAGPCCVTPSMAVSHHSAPSLARGGPSLHGHPLPWRWCSETGLILTPSHPFLLGSAPSPPLLPPDYAPPAMCDAWEQLVLHQAQPGHGPFPLQPLRQLGTEGQQDLLAP